MSDEKISVMLSKAEIQERISGLGVEISRHYGHLEEPLVMVGVLKGSVIFLADLCRALSIPVELEFIGVSSYGAATESSGVVQITQDLTRPINDRHVLLVEDIVDTGLTAKYLFDNLKNRGPESISMCSLLVKPDKCKVDVEILFQGFSIEDKFVVGYGLDLAGLYRNLPYVGALKS